MKRLFFVGVFGLSKGTFSISWYLASSVDLTNKLKKMSNEMAMS